MAELSAPNLSADTTRLIFLSLATSMRGRAQEEKKGTSMRGRAQEEKKGHGD
jgi:hypothetical protein